MIKLLLSHHNFQKEIATDWISTANVPTEGGTGLVNTSIMSPVRLDLTLATTTGNSDNNDKKQSHPIMNTTLNEFGILKNRLNPMMDHLPDPAVP